MRILVVEDEAGLREGLIDLLQGDGHEVTAVIDGATAAATGIAESWDLVVLDLMLPRMNGMDVCRKLRGARPGMPILMLTARGSEDDKVRGLGEGADDYVTKPFSPRELLARVRALLRRASPEASEDPIEIAGLRLEPSTFRVYAGEHPLELSPTEFRLLHFFMRNPDRVLSRTRLLDNVWGDHVYIEERTVDVHIRRLRLALSPGGHDRLIETVRGGGYRFLPR